MPVQTGKVTVRKKSLLLLPQLDLPAVDWESPEIWGMEAGEAGFGEERNLRAIFQCSYFLQVNPSMSPRDQLYWHEISCHHLEVGNIQPHPNFAQ